MADEVQALTKAFSGLGGLGVDEPTMVAALANWRRQPEKRSGFRKSFPGLFKEHGVIERCEDEYMLHLAAEFSRFKNLMVLWAMHPWERDARLAHHVLHQAHPAAIVVEVACTRSAEELLGASKPHLVQTFKYYKELHGKHIEEDLGSEEALREAVQCLATPERYFSQVMAAALREGADHHGKEALARVAVTRSDVDMDGIRAAYQEQFGAKLEDAVAGSAHGHFRDALVSLIVGK
ncbi:hypothetical protein VPH35_015131 [Triticum aestivum]|uniref:Annexin n=1 Tax=Triticum aestivum TaxID=4565 RepID=A0A3B5ZX16_WHEAT